MEKRNKIRYRIHRAKRKLMMVVQKLGNELKTVSWGIELIKTLITTIAVSFFTVLILYLVRVNSPGDFYGPRLETELKAMVADQIYCSPEITEFQFIYIGELSSIDNQDLIIGTGTYSDPRNERNSGRFLSVFAPSRRTIWNDLLHTSPKYQVDFLRIFPIEGGGILTSTILDYNALYAEDINADFYNEFVISFSSHYALRTSNVSAFLSWTSDGWKCASLDVSFLDKAIQALSETDYEVLYDQYPLLDGNGNKTEDRIIGLAYGGTVYSVVDPCWNRQCMLYKVPINDGKTGYMATDEYVYVMAILEDGRLRVSNNWNCGAPLLSKDVPDGLSESLDFVQEYWGIETENGVFYTEP